MAEPTRFLMGIFAVPKGLPQWHRLQPGALSCGGLVGHPAADRRVVRRSVLKRFQGQLAPQLRRHAPARLRHGGQQTVVLVRAGENSHISMVFGGRPNHGGATDVDVLDRLIPGDVRSSNRLAEGIEVDHHHIDVGDVLLLKISLVGRVTPLGQNPAMHPWMERFHTTAKNFWSPGVLRHTGHRKAGLLEHLGRAPTGEQLIAMGPMQGLRQGHQPGLIGNTQQSDRSHRRIVTGS